MQEYFELFKAGGSMNIKKLYNKRVNDIISTCNHREPLNVPVMANVLTWAFGYANCKIAHYLYEPEAIPETYNRFFEDIYCDLNFKFGINAPIPAIERLGSESFFVSSDDHTIQHRERCYMKDNEYPELIEDPLKFLIDVLGRRKFPEFSKSKEDVYQALIDVTRYIDRLDEANQSCAYLAAEKYGIVNITGNHKVYAPVDVIFDRLRGIRGTLADVNRQKENLIKAAQAIYPIYHMLVENITSQFPYALSTLHAPTCLRPRDFTEVFWPTMRELVMEVYNSGSKTLLFMEGKWKHNFHTMLDDLPQSSILCMLEEDDPVEAKKIIGDRFTIVGGVNTNLLRLGTRQECLDEAKRIIDGCAPGGGFIFSTEKSLISLGDVNIDNFIAVNQFVHEYGKY